MNTFLVVAALFWISGIVGIVFIQRAYRKCLSAERALQIAAGSDPVKLDRDTYLRRIKNLKRLIVGLPVLYGLDVLVNLGKPWLQLLELTAVAAFFVIVIARALRQTRKKLAELDSSCPQAN
jgi:hypothetical protein